MYVCCCLTGLLGIILVEEWLLTQMNDMKRFLVYEESSGRVVMKNIWGQYHVAMSWYYVIILCLCYAQAILRDTPAKWKQCGLQHVGTSMDKTLESRLLGRNSVVWMCGTTVVHCCTCCICDVACMRCFVCMYIYKCTYFLCNVMYMVVQIVLRECCIHSDRYR